MDSEDNKSLFAHSISGHGNISISSSMDASISTTGPYSVMTPISASTSSVNFYDLVDHGNRSTISSMAGFKRWNSLPMGMNLNFCIRCPDPSSSSSSSDDEDASTDPNSSEMIPSLASIERKSTSMCFDRRSNSASGGGFAMRHRSSSSALYLPSVPFRLLDKGIEKLKREANIGKCIETDYAGEKMSITGAAIMFSMDEFNIAEDSGMANIEQRRRTQSLTEPVHVLTNLLPASCSPSPTRIEKQCYSPSMQQVVRSIAMSPTSSPSPTRRQCIRSLSPIALRTGMGIKRKCTGDSDTDGYATTPPIKRAHYSVPTTPPVVTVENVQTPVLYPSVSQTLNHSLSESSIDSECSNSTIGSDFTNISNTSHGIYRPLSNNAASGAFAIGIEEIPIIEESAIDEDT